MHKTVIGLVIVVIIGAIGINFARFAHKETVKTTVTDKERIVKRSGDNIDSYYLIYTEDGTLKLEDELLYGNFNSSDWYGKIKVDSTYEFTTIGWRIGFLSEYPNIVEYK